MGKNISKKDILKLLKEFEILISDTLKKELQNSNSPTFKELENAALDFYYHQQMMKARSKGDQNIITENSEVNSSMLDQMVKERIAMQINQTFLYLEEIIKFKKIGRTGEYLAAELDSKRLANCIIIKQKILAYAEKMNEQAIHLSKIRKKIKLVASKEHNAKEILQAQLAQHKTLVAHKETLQAKVKLLEDTEDQLTDKLKEIEAKERAVEEKLKISNAKEQALLKKWLPQTKH